ncbi:Aorsin [Grifola frondosa]|uniref:tripeptidyl-peptidase II n=1 Tax=Grifola frondosa TaxID=5627 RepID=A0A1C7LU26_GRIFR|nr:Aorsin [Grifola frondosa]
MDEFRVKLSTGGGWLLVNITVEEAEHLLGTEYYVYEHGEDGTEHIACADGYHLPAHVSKHVEIITPTLHFDAHRKRRLIAEKRSDLNLAKKVGTLGASPKIGETLDSVSTDLSHCDQAITLACLRVLYSFDYEPVAASKNSIGIVEYTPQAHNPSDFDLFFGNFSSSQVGQRPTLVSIDGGFIDSAGSKIESSLDLQYAMGLVGKKQEVQLYQVGDAVEGGSFNNLLDALDASFCTFEGGDDPNEDGIYPDPFGGYQGPESCGIVKPAFIISTSYGHNEADLTPAYAQRQCAEYGKLGLMGVTILYSSGDVGVAGRNNVCLEPNGTQVLGAPIFDPSFPGGCPFVTSVGATQVVPGNKVTDPESAVFQRFPSGGGFSNVFPIPEFQKNAIHEYLTKFPPPYASNIFNASGRAHPDIAANGLNFTVIINGSFILISGTSASTPAAAAILSAINDARLRFTRLPSGAFNDITNGSNPGCGTAGFKAEPGWDPVTGLGTLNFRKLLDRWLSLRKRRMTDCVGVSEVYAAGGAPVTAASIFQWRMLFCGAELEPERGALSGLDLVVRKYSDALKRTPLTTRDRPGAVDPQHVTDSKPHSSQNSNAADNRHSIAISPPRTHG